MHKPTSKDRAAAERHSEQEARKQHAEAQKGRDAAVGKERVDKALTGFFGAMDDHGGAPAPAKAKAAVPAKPKPAESGSSGKPVSSASVGSPITRSPAFVAKLAKKVNEIGRKLDAIQGDGIVKIYNSVGNIVATLDLAALMANVVFSNWVYDTGYDAAQQMVRDGLVDDYIRDTAEQMVRDGVVDDYIIALITDNAPVKSVAGKTGDVTLVIGDIGDVTTTGVGTCDPGGTIVFVTKP